MVESDGLENRCTLTGTVGSNPTLSAIISGKVQEWLNWQHWKCCEPQKGSVGSNPTLSARKRITKYQLRITIGEKIFIS